MTWNDLEWPFYDKCSLLRTAFWQLSYITVEFVYAEYLESAKQLRIFRI